MIASYLTAKNRAVADWNSSQEKWEAFIAWKNCCRSSTTTLAIINWTYRLSISSWQWVTQFCWKESRSWFSQPANRATPGFSRWPNRVFYLKLPVSAHYFSSIQLLGAMWRASRCHIWVQFSGWQKAVMDKKRIALPRSDSQHWIDICLGVPAGLLQV